LVSLSEPGQITFLRANGAVEHAAQILHDASDYVMARTAAVMERIILA
jgi:hypothetical protein